MKKNNLGRKKITKPGLKKEIKDFLISEEGKVNKKDIVKIGASLALLSTIFPNKALADHDNYFFSAGRGGHNSHNSHSSHSSHGSHGSGGGGWC